MPSAELLGAADIEKRGALRDEGARVAARDPDGGEA
jgi:hypothetical protein